MSVGKLSQSRCHVWPEFVAEIASVDSHLNGARLDHGETNQYNSALLTILLELLKEEEPDLYSPALKRIEARRKGSRLDRS
jgi:hypothetical protein